MGMGQPQHIGIASGRQLPDPRHGQRRAVNTSDGGPEKPKAADRRKAQSRSDIHPQRHGCQHFLNIMLSSLIECRQRRRDHRGHRMNHGAFMHRVPFQTVDRKAVDVSRAVCRHSQRSIAQQPASTALTPALRCRQNSLHPWTGPTRSAHRQGIGNQSLGCSLSMSRQPVLRGGKIKQVLCCAHPRLPP
jgi:hypothetical protein